MSRIRHDTVCPDKNIPTFPVYFQAVRNPDRCEVDGTFGAVSPVPGAMPSTANGAPIAAVLPVAPARLGWR